MNMASANRELISRFDTKDFFISRKPQFCKEVQSTCNILIKFYFWT